MPIVVYFFKKDLFLLWSQNILYSKKINYIKQEKDKIKRVNANSDEIEFNKKVDEEYEKLLKNK